MFKLSTIVLTISESTTVIFKLGKGVPGAIFSGIKTKQSLLLKTGGSSLTSCTVIVTFAREELNLSSKIEPLASSLAYINKIILSF